MRTEQEIREALAVVDERRVDTDKRELQVLADCMASVLLWTMGVHNTRFGNFIQPAMEERIK